jgi:hypothetical protein
MSRCGSVGMGVQGPIPVASMSILQLIFRSIFDSICWKQAAPDERPSLALSRTAVVGFERCYEDLMKSARQVSDIVLCLLCYIPDLRPPPLQHDPWAASKWFAEAERLEAVEEEGRNNDVSLW